MRLSPFKVFLDWDHRWWISLEPHAQRIYDPGAQSWVKSMFHKDFWETASTVFKVCSNIVEEMLTDTVILILMNMFRLCRASQHSCQDLRPRVTSAVQEEEEGKAPNEQMLSIILLDEQVWPRQKKLSPGRQSCTAEQSRQSYQGTSHLQTINRRFFSQGRAEGMWDLHQCQGTHIHDTLRAAARAADTWRVAQQPHFAVNKSILSPEQGSKVSLPAWLLS